MDMLINQVVSFVFIVHVHQFSVGRPINYGFTYKFNPSNFKEEFKQKVYSNRFTKTPLVQTPPMNKQTEPGVTGKDHPSLFLFTQRIKTKEAGDGMATTQQLVTKALRFEDYLRVPLPSDKFAVYNVVVATAPQHLRISGNKSQPLVVYIIFQADENDLSKLSLPKVYFVSKSESADDVIQKAKDPVIIVDSNRTVTGIKSHEIAKFVKFKNKLTDKRNFYIH